MLVVISVYGCGAEAEDEPRTRRARPPRREQNRQTGHSRCPRHDDGSLCAPGGAQRSAVFWNPLECPGRAGSGAPEGASPANRRGRSPHRGVWGVVPPENTRTREAGRRAPNLGGGRPPIKDTTPGSGPKAREHGGCCPPLGGRAGGSGTARPWGGWPEPFYSKAYLQSRPCIAIAACDPPSTRVTRTRELQHECLAEDRRSGPNFTLGEVLAARPACGDLSPSRHGPRAKVRSFSSGETCAPRERGNTGGNCSPGRQTRQSDGSGGRERARRTSCARPRGAAQGAGAFAALNGMGTSSSIKITN
jgi:hypothetical protein